MGRSLIAAFALWLVAASGAAAEPANQDVTTQVTAQGDIDDSDAVGGPATIYIGTIDISPGASYAGWHTHPGPVWVVIVGGQLAVYGPDGCRTEYNSGSAYLAEPNTTYDLENESDAPLQLQFAGVIPKGQRPTIPAPAPSATCPG
jgi:quercetin dioxygenase-like cupin family protein